MKKKQVKDEENAMNSFEVQRRKMPKDGKVNVEAEFSNYLGKRCLFNKAFAGRQLALMMISVKLAREMGTELHADNVVGVLVMLLGVKDEYEAMLDEA